MSASVTPIRSRLDTAWADYLTARDRAEETGAMEDGIAAGRAWRRWLELSLTDDQKAALDATNVIGFPR